MRAINLASPFPTVRRSTPAIAAARLLADQNLPGLIVLDDAGRPWTVLPGTQVLRMAIPSYCQEDPTLARVIDEPAADVFITGLGDRSVEQCLDPDQRDVPVVDPDATLLEIAALMATEHAPVVAVLNPDGTLRGAITVDALLDRVFQQ
ncbi:MAG TPA: CBS domain-containing protein [Dermatophilaceae bacterium]|nr:CBS domain-containing protein [Dermatophilaceae bacterium]